MSPEKRTKQLRRSLHGAVGQAASGYTEHFLKPPGGSEHAQQPGTGLGFLPTEGHVHVLGVYSLSKGITEDPQRTMPTLLGYTASQRDLSTPHTNFPWPCFFTEFAFTPSVLVTLYNTTQDLYVLLDAKNHLFVPFP